MGSTVNGTCSMVSSESTIAGRPIVGEDMFNGQSVLASQIKFYTSLLGSTQECTLYPNISHISTNKKNAMMPLVRLSLSYAHLLPLVPLKMHDGKIETSRSQVLKNLEV